MLLERNLTLPWRRTKQASVEEADTSIWKLTKKNHTEESEPLLAKLPVNAHSSCVMLVKIGHTTFKCSLGYDYY